ncbi:MAG: hypothetical protein Q9157_008354, partial [Trypethelium eluteriae]
APFAFGVVFALVDGRGGAAVGAVVRGGFEVGGAAGGEVERRRRGRGRAGGDLGDFVVVEDLDFAPAGAGEGPGAELRDAAVHVFGGPGPAEGVSDVAEVVPDLELDVCAFPSLDFGCDAIFGRVNRWWIFEWISSFVGKIDLFVTQKLATSDLDQKRRQPTQGRLEYRRDERSNLPSPATLGKECVKSTQGLNKIAPAGAAAIATKSFHPRLQPHVDRVEIEYVLQLDRGLRKECANKTETLVIGDMGSWLLMERLSVQILQCETQEVQNEEDDWTAYGPAEAIRSGNKKEWVKEGRVRMVHVFSLYPGLIGDRGVARTAAGAVIHEVRTQLEAGIWYTLCLWPELVTAVSNQWGGPESAEKRDWLAGHISDLLIERPDTDAEDIETRLLEVLEDEFDARLETESEVAVARDILLLREDTLEGNFQRVQDLRARYERKGKSVGLGPGVEIVEHIHEDDGDEDWDGEDEDLEMSDAPAPVPAREIKPKQEPEVDEDGFTKVVGKKKT